MNSKHKIRSSILIWFFLCFICFNCACGQEISKPACHKQYRDCRGTGIGVSIVDQDNIPLHSTDILYSSDLGHSGNACTNQINGCNWVWVPIELEDAIYTFVVSYADEEQEKTVPIKTDSATYNDCCGTTLRRDLRFVFDLELMDI